jgi:tetratricopeptide (TPR) repeat protein
MLPRAPTRPRTSGTDHLIGIGLGAAVFGLFALELLRDVTIAKLSAPFILAAYVPLLVIHELGHALAAWLVGSRVSKVVIGMGRPIWRFRFAGVPVTLRLVPVSGYVIATPRSLDGARWRSAVVYLGGPGIELLLLAALAVAVGPAQLLAPAVTVSEVALQSVAVALALDVAFNLAPIPTADGALRDGLGIVSSPFLSDARLQAWIAGGVASDIEPLLEVGRVDGAVEVVEQATLRHPDNVHLVFLLASLLREAGRPREAGQRLEPWLERTLPDASLAIVHAHVASAARDLDDPDLYEVAAEHITKALELFPGELTFLMIRATIQLERGQTGAAAESLEQCLDGLRALPLEIGDEDHRPRDECETWLALARLQQGRTNVAREHLKRLIDRGARGRLLDRLNQALALDEVGADTPGPGIGNPVG